MLKQLMLHADDPQQALAELMEAAAHVQLGLEHHPWMTGLTEIMVAQEQALAEKVLLAEVAAEVAAAYVPEHSAAEHPYYAYL